jgi:hypothetical protein
MSVLQASAVTRIREVKLRLLRITVPYLVIFIGTSHEQGHRWRQGWRTPPCNITTKAWETVNARVQKGRRRGGAASFRVAPQMEMGAQAWAARGWCRPGGTGREK